MLLPDAWWSTRWWKKKLYENSEMKFEILWRFTRPKTTQLCVVSESKYLFLKILRMRRECEIGTQFEDGMNVIHFMAESEKINERIELLHENNWMQEKRFFSFLSDWFRQYLIGFSSTENGTVFLHNAFSNVCELLFAVDISTRDVSSSN